MNKFLQLNIKQLIFTLQASSISFSHNFLEASRACTELLQLASERHTQNPWSTTSVLVTQLVQIEHTAYSRTMTQYQTTKTYGPIRNTSYPIADTLSLSSRTTKTQDTLLHVQPKQLKHRTDIYQCSQEQLAYRTQLSTIVCVTKNSQQKEQLEQIDCVAKTANTQDSSPQTAEHRTLYRLCRQNSQHIQDTCTIVCVYKNSEHIGQAFDCYQEQRVCIQNTLFSGTPIERTLSTTDKTPAEHIEMYIWNRMVQNKYQ